MRVLRHYGSHFTGRRDFCFVLHGGRPSCSARTASLVCFPASRRLAHFGRRFSRTSVFALEQRSSMALVRCHAYLGFHQPGELRMCSRLLSTVGNSHSAFPVVPLHSLAVLQSGVISHLRRKSSPLVRGYGHRATISSWILFDFRGLLGCLAPGLSRFGCRCGLFFELVSVDYPTCSTRYWFIARPDLHNGLILANSSFVRGAIQTPDVFTNCSLRFMLSGVRHTWFSPALTRVQSSELTACGREKVAFLGYPIRALRGFCIHYQVQGGL